MISSLRRPSRASSANRPPTVGAWRSTIARALIAVAVDSTPNYPADSNAALVSGFLRSFVLDAATTARRLTLTNIPIPPFKFKLYVRNDTGQVLAASGNTLKYRRHNEQIV